MEERRAYFNPFRMLSLKQNNGPENLERLHLMSISDAASLEQALLITISKIIELTRLLSECVLQGTEREIGTCASLAREVQEQEVELTTMLLGSDAAGDLLEGLIRFPFRLRRIGDMLESIVNSCRIKSEERIAFSHRAHSELDQVLVVLLDILCNVRDAFRSPKRLLLQSIILEGAGLHELLSDYRKAHWDRLKDGTEDPSASSVYLCILDSVGSINDYVGKLCSSLLELRAVMPASEELREEHAGPPTPNEQRDEIL